MHQLMTHLVHHPARHQHLLLKIDLKDAYRMVPVHTCDCHLLVVCWREQAYIDQALPSGLRSAPKLFTAVADAIGWALFQVGVSLHLHHLDDFFFLPPRCTHPHLVLSYIYGVLESLVSQLHGTRQDPQLQSHSCGWLWT